MKKALLIVCLFISVIASGQGNFFWSHNSSGGYGLLYNWYAATSTDKITSSDDWVVPSTTNYNTLMTYLGGYLVAGGYLKQTGYLYWNTPNTGATNLTLFFGRGAGVRVSSDGSFSLIKAFLVLATTDNLVFGSIRPYSLYNASTEFKESSGFPADGISIRLLYVGAGTPTQYVGNNGYVYRVVQIGTQYWLAQNLRETKWRNGTDIPNVTDNTAWSALTTPAWCVYDNNFKYR